MTQRGRGDFCFYLVFTAGDYNSLFLTNVRRCIKTENVKTIPTMLYFDVPFLCGYSKGSGRQYRRCVVVQVVKCVKFPETSRVTYYAICMRIIYRVFTRCWDISKLHVKAFARNVISSALFQGYSHCTREILL